ncbi:hypothetical protein QTP70_032297 [Hemibagrus guttatus]|uniref:Uncharacterized protein n=1 Tax=Hemibagrus guttatus TaxID=175788 RepID=A0AAE0RM54_9TELE|nr:hypothetical protein QTP70_032297 [Hemibagrus guttatus]
MASAQVPLTNVGSGYTIVTQVIPASEVQNTAGQNSPQIHNPLQKFLKGEPKALGAVQIINGVWMMGIGVFALLGYSIWGQVLSTRIAVMCLMCSLLQFAISISISVFACKATCSNEPTMNIINAVPNPEGYIPVENSFPAHPGISTFNTVAMSHAPVDSPPVYTEIKDESED